MKVAFELSMPRKGSWNGKWSGEGDLYAIVQDIGTSKIRKEKFQNIINNGPYSYNFGDGWCASITVKFLDPSEVRGYKKRIKGFCGYNWMINSILQHGCIKP